MLHITKSQNAMCCVQYYTLYGPSYNNVQYVICSKIKNQSIMGLIWKMT